MWDGVAVPDTGRANNASSNEWTISSLLSSLAENLDYQSWFVAWDLVSAFIGLFNPELIMRDLAGLGFLPQKSTHNMRHPFWESCEWAT